MEAAASVEAHDSAHDESLHKAALTPPTSEDMDKRERSSSPLSDMELDNPEEEDIGEIEPDHYWDGGKIPVFKPVGSIAVQSNNCLRQHDACNYPLSEI